MYTYQSHVYDPKRISETSQLGRLAKMIFPRAVETHELYDQVP